jgi:hypothetical protein
VTKEVRYRDAVSGEYVTEEYAREHPDTTVAETADDEDTLADLTDEAPYHRQEFYPEPPTGDDA